MGSGLSPNGLPFSEEGVVSLALLDKVKYLDLQRGQVTVEAGARIQPVRPQPPPCLPSCSQSTCDNQQFCVWSLLVRVER